MKWQDVPPWESMDIQQEAEVIREILVDYWAGEYKDMNMGDIFDKLLVNKDFAHHIKLNLPDLEEGIAEAVSCTLDFGFYFERVRR